MISVSNREWGERKFNENLVNKCSQDNNFSLILSKLIVTRNFIDDEIYTINNSKNVNFSNVFKFNSDFNKSIDLVIKNIKNKSKICILGDYDVDGSCATALLIKFLKSINQPLFFYIPDRIKDGYGPSIKLFKKIISKSPKLIIMVDCGSTSIDAVNYLNENNIDSLIIDHHQINKPFPKANSIINPKKDNGYIKYDYMCATSLTYFFLDLLIDKLNIKTNFILENFMIYVLLATVCDVMPLRFLNRIIAIKTLNKFQLNNVTPIKKIYEILDIKKRISIDDLGYLIGPILNSGGRLSKSNYAADLLSTNNEKNMTNLINKLIKLNEQRKKIEQKILEEIDFNKIEKENKKIIIIYKLNLNEGLIGIIAARLKEYFNKPVIVITNSNDFLKGSARSTPNFDIGLAINNAFDQKLIISGGGHKMAAGFSLKKSKLEDFINGMNTLYSKGNIDNEKNLFFYESKISTTAFNKDFYNEINKLTPFGTGNNEPLFLFEKLKIVKAKIVKKKHITNFFKSKNGFLIQSISFNSTNTKIGEYLLNYKKEISVIGQIKENFWNNKSSLQLSVRDLII
jgi:single-stranded-DNA-specific exonuclease